MSIFDYNGSAVVAMTGKNCVAIARLILSLFFSDKRFSTERKTISTNRHKIYKISSKVFLGMAGLGSDVSTVAELVAFRHNLYKLREDRDMGPNVLTNMIANLLYEKRFGPYFITPIIAGLDSVCLVNIYNRTIILI